MDAFENDNNNEVDNSEILQAEVVDKTPGSPRYNWKKELWEWTQSLGLALIIVIIIRTFLFTLVLVDGPSMEKTLETGDRLYVNRFMYTPKNGDIIVFTPEKYPKKPFIKRVIAVPGQSIDIDFENARVIVDGVILDEEYVNTPTTKNGDITYPITVPEGYFFAMGDNRARSHDCRSSDVGDEGMNGLVSNKRVMGKALFRIWPFDKFGKIY